MGTKICQFDGCINNKIWGKGYCKYHFLQVFPPKALKKSGSIKKITPRQIEKNKLKSVKSKELGDFFLALWNSQEDIEGNCYCFETGKRMSREVYRENRCCYSHCLPKGKYPQFALEKANTLIVLPDVHAQWEVNQDKCPKMKEYYLNIKEIYLG